MMKKNYLVFLQFIFPLELLRCLVCKSSISFSRALTAQHFRRKLGSVSALGLSLLSLSLSLSALSSFPPFAPPRLRTRHTTQVFFALFSVCFSLALHSVCKERCVRVCVCVPSCGDFFSVSSDSPLWCVCVCVCVYVFWRNFLFFS